MVSVAELLKKAWYDRVPSSLGLSDSFRYVYTDKPFNISSLNIYRLCDMLIAAEKRVDKSIFFSISRDNGSFFSAYSTLVKDCIQYPASDTLRRVLSDDYISWDAARNALPVQDRKDEIKVTRAFDKWADMHLDPGKKARAQQALRQEFRNVVTSAKKMLELSSNFDDGKALYSPTDKDILKGMDSATSTSGSFSDNDLVFKIKYKRILTIPVERGGWFSSSLIGYAKESTDNTVWKTSSPLKREYFFGENGVFLQSISSLVLIDGLDATITVPAVDDNGKAENMSIITDTGNFFSTMFKDIDIHHRINDDDMIFTVRSAEGNPVLLGVNMTDLAVN